MLTDKLKEIRRRIEEDHHYSWREALLALLEANEPTSHDVPGEQVPTEGESSSRRRGRSDVQGGG